MITVHEIIKAKYGDRIALKVKEVGNGELLPISTSHIYGLMAEGRFPYIQLGDTKLIPVPQLVELMEREGAFAPIPRSASGVISKNQVGKTATAAATSRAWRKDH